MIHDPAAVVGPPGEVVPGAADADHEAGAGLWADAWRDQRPNTTWGLLIAEGEPYALEGWPHLLLVPCAFLVVTVLAFIMLGDLLRDALDPRSR